ncbi:MAG: hypothetical protein J4F44_06110, partial [Acidimicrobiia bacterium]|nr:hypothetical protein [Acidimicrobiia bacterium]
MKLKRLLVLAGVLALLGMLWASPAAADGHLPSITLDPDTVPAEVGDVTITVSGSNWTEPTPFFIVACPGAAGDPAAPLTLSSAPDAIAMCPNLMASALAVEWDDGSFTTEWTVGITQADIDIGGLVVMAGWLSADTLADPEAFATVGLLNIGEAEQMDDTGEEEPADDPAEEEPMDDTGDEEPMDDMGDEEPMDDTGDEEPMDDMGDEEPMDDPGDEELPVTGSDSSLLVIVGAGILAAGLLVIGAGGRVGGYAVGPSSVAGDVTPGNVPVHLRFLRESEHTLAEDVAHDLRRATFDGVGACAQEQPAGVEGA